MNRVNHVVLGRFLSAYGLKGWIKIHSYTQPAENLFSYSTWNVLIQGSSSRMRLKDFRLHTRGFVACFYDMEDSDSISVYSGLDIVVCSVHLPVLPKNEYYWNQLIGLDVETENGINLGCIDHVMVTGSNDVLAVINTSNSFDDNDRLIPWIVNQVIKDVNLLSKVIIVDWDLEF